jgi:hypothetical protein
MISARTNPITMTEITDPAVVAEVKAQHERMRRISDWLEAHASKVYTQHRGKCICVCGQELFVGDSAEEVLARARAAHPEDDGLLLRYIPQLTSSQRGEE